MDVNRQPEMGEQAPLFKATTATGDSFDLADQLGNWVVIWFFVRSNTPGWTHEAKDFQARKSQFDALGARIVGVSADKGEVQKRFVDAYDLEFPLVPDPDKHIIDAYGAREVVSVVAKRRTFLIGPDGKIARVWQAVTVEGHAEEVLSAIQSLGGAGAASVGGEARP
jgi:peroxiredoxin Q/BCP